MIKYNLRRNAISQDPNAKFARVIAKEVYGLNDLISECLRRGSTLTETDLRAAVTLLFKVMVDMVKDGNFLNTPVVNLRPSVSGTFNGNNDSFDQSRHMLGVSASAGLEMRKALQEAHVEKVLYNGVHPLVICYQDAASNTEDAQITAGSIGTLIGKELDFNPANAEEGLFFHPMSGGAEIKAQVFQKRAGGTLVFLVPALAAGNYRIIVRKAYTNSVELREGKLDKVLSVV